MTTLKTVTLPAIPSVPVLAEMVASADNAVVGCFQSEAGKVIIFSDSGARDAYCAHVSGIFTDKGEFSESHPETGEEVIIAYTFFV